MQTEYVARKAIKSAINQGASEVEAYATRSRVLIAYVDDGNIKSVEEKHDLGVSVRVCLGKKMGQASSTVTNIRMAETCAENAVDLAKFSAADPDFKGLSTGERGISQATFDMDLAGITPDILVSKADAVVAAIEDQGAKVPNGLVRVGAMQWTVANTNGIEVEGKGTLLYSHFTGMAVGDKPGEGVGAVYANRLLAFEPSAMGDGIGQRAQQSAKAVAFRGHEHIPVIIRPGDLAEMLGSTVGFAVSGENVSKKRSPWVDAKGKDVASSIVTIKDSPLDERGVFRSSFDDEGLACEERDVIEAGRLRTFLHDSYSAKLLNDKPTGNAFRRGHTDALGAYRQPLTISPSNLVVQRGKTSLAEMVSGIKRGLIVEKTASAEVNGVSGAFGFEVRLGLLIEDGVVTQPVSRCLLVGNFYEALKNVQAIGDDATVVGGVITPSICFASLEIIGE
ncbi:MAG: TldD/PmbA family protein [Methanomassiliicoccales archaeon]